MEKQKLTHILVDTNALWSIRHPDFQKVVQLSKVRGFKIIVPYIVWEERRTQLLETEFKDVVKLQDAYSRLERRKPESILGRLDLPPFSIWDSDQVAEASRAHMEDLARENNIEVIPLDPTHAERAWERYFEVSPPFNPQEKREKRRQDIPDSWIFESAIDLYSNHGHLVALCNDGKLSVCFDSIGVQIFRTATEIVALLEEGESKSVLSSTTEKTASTESASLSTPTLDHLLERAQQLSRDAEQKILGFVGYLNALTKRDLAILLELAGITPEIGQNAAERLALSGLIQDTGNAYLPRNKDACDLAAALAEPIMIQFLSKA